jgi:hypothetical protein
MNTRFRNNERRYGNADYSKAWINLFDYVRAWVNDLF